MINAVKNVISQALGNSTEASLRDGLAVDALRKELFKREGSFAKASFLLSRLSGQEATSPERAVAFLGLMDDIDNILASLPPEDHARLQECVDAAMGRLKSNALMVARLDVDGSLVDQALIDGTFVKRVVVAPAEDEERVLDVARIELPAGRCYALSTEYTFDCDGQATLEVVECATQSVLAAARLENGHNRFAHLKATLAPGIQNAVVTIRIRNASTEEPVFWHQTEVYEEQAPEGSVSALAAFSEELKKQRTIKTRSVFQPVTGEPLDLADIDRMNGLRNKFSGQRIFIMGNGPSLNNTPLELLKNEYVFGLNRVSLLFDRISWRPTFFTAFDVRVVPDNKEEFANLDVPYKFFSARYKQMMGLKDAHYWYHTKGFYEGFETCFEPMVAYSGFGGGGTIAIIAIELAYFMGFREIYLIGTDVSYSVPKTVAQSGKDVFGDGVKLELESTQDDDANHFDPRYFGKGKKWHNPNVRDMKIGFARAASYIEQRGGMLRNATVGGQLDEVPRVNFEALF
ncbi:6-hydroxymethylpterin diphosphokinase MptE-like protein [Rhizorhapis sp. SPR117]|uniref:6-hydroxymethylpterin diphosphokinase MptE-like protein n=1 Tax=Rhizorhapis sp. SPR117 TaxID=2912611 RepID=UPI001F421B4F|nr:DUF115 domain-containing protein [Rhizorhapis sp. SPR117]